MPALPTDPHRAAAFVGAATTAIGAALVASPEGLGRRVRALRRLEGD